MTNLSTKDMQALIDRLRNDEEDDGIHGIFINKLSLKAAEALTAQRAEIARLRSAAEDMQERAVYLLGRALDTLTSGPFDASDSRIEALAEYVETIRALPVEGGE